MQMAVEKGLKVPCLFMITEVSIRCPKNLEVAIRRIPAYTPQYTTGKNWKKNDSNSFFWRRSLIEIDAKVSLVVINVMFV